MKDAQRMLRHKRKCDSKMWKAGTEGGRQKRGIWNGRTNGKEKWQRKEGREREGERE